MAFPHYFHWMLVLSAQCPVLWSTAAQWRWARGLCRAPLARSGPRWPRWAHDLCDLRDLCCPGATGDENHPAGGTCGGSWSEWGGGRYLEQGSKSGQSSPQCLERACGRGVEGTIWWLQCSSEVLCLEVGSKWSLVQVVHTALAMHSEVQLTGLAGSRILPKLTPAW